MLFGWPVPPWNREFDLDGEETVRAASCRKLSARQGSDVVSLWIGIEDSVLYKVFQRIQTKEMSDAEWRQRRERPSAEGKHPIPESMPKPGAQLSETTIEYIPRMDRPIEPARFDFTPPKMPTAQPKAADP